MLAKRPTIVIVIVIWTNYFLPKQEIINLLLVFSSLYPDSRLGSRSLLLIIVHSKPTPTTLFSSDILDVCIRRFTQVEFFLGEAVHCSCLYVRMCIICVCKLLHCLCDATLYCCCCVESCILKRAMLVYTPSWRR